jgi:hypothetical protein
MGLIRDEWVRPAGVAAAGRTVAASARRLLGLLEGDGENGLVAGSNSVQGPVDGGAADSEQLRQLAGRVVAAGVQGRQVGFLPDGELWSAVSQNSIVSYSRRPMR